MQKLQAEQLGSHHFQAMLTVIADAPQAMLHASFGLQPLGPLPQTQGKQAHAVC